MRKVKLFIASSLDGNIARDNGGIDWLFHDLDYGYTDFFAGVDTVIAGRKTYDHAKEFEVAPFKGKKIYVFTRKQIKPTKDVEFINSPVEFVKKLKTGRGKDIWLVGGSQIVTELLNAGLIDEMIISIHPIIIGTGIPLFKKIEKQVHLKVEKSIDFPTGLIQVWYTVKSK